MSPDLEGRLIESDRHRAEQYTSMEALAARFTEIAQGIDESADSIPEPIDDEEEEDSLVYHLEQAGLAVAAAR